MSVLPSDIRNLPAYIVPGQLFICTIIAFILFCIAAIVITITWIVRSCKHIYNYEYVANHQFIVYQKNKQQKLRYQDPDEVYNNPNDENTSSKTSQFSVTTETRYREYNRNQSRFLEFVCLSVVLVIHINAFACNIFELVAFSIAALCFLVFNILIRRDDKEWLRLIFFVPLIVAFIPFYFESKTLKNP